MDTMYKLHMPIGIRSHYDSQTSICRDGEDDLGQHLITNARVRSGDYFLTLATELDQLAQSKAAADDPEAPELERLVAELLYVHGQYRVVARGDSIPS